MSNANIGAVDTTRTQETARNRK